MKSLTPSFVIMRMVIAQMDTLEEVNNSFLYLIFIGCNECQCDQEAVVIFSFNFLILNSESVNVTITLGIIIALFANGNHIPFLSSFCPFLQ